MKKTHSRMFMRLMTSVGMAAITFGAHAALAQTAAPAPATQDAAPAANADIQVVVVTGSRLAARGYKTPSPVTTLDSNELKLQGTQNVETALVQSPQFVGNQYNASGNGQNGGVAALNLRGLGERRSLTLVNGRRYTLTGTAGLTDLNTIPSALVKRIEIVTGGSSAVYGSDALAGVVNFIMKDDFQGMEVNVQRRWDEHTATPTSSVDLTMGGNFDGGKGNTVVSLGYYDREGITRGQFAFANSSLLDSCVTSASFNPNGAGVALAVPAGQTCTSAGGRAGFVNGFSSATPNGRFIIPLFGAAGTSPGYNSALTAAGLQNVTGLGFTLDPPSTAARPYASADAWNNQPYNLIQTPLRRWTINTFTHYDVNNHATAYMETHFSDYSADVQIAPYAVQTNLLYNTNNPYLSAADQNVLSQLDQQETCPTSGCPLFKIGAASYTNTPGDGRVVINTVRRLLEGGPGINSLHRRVFRTALGVRGDITDNLKYDLYYTYAYTGETDSQTATISLSRLQAGVLSQGGAAPALNLFGQNLTAASYASISVPQTNLTDNEQQVVAGNLTGSLFQLPAGPVDFNTGFEWRYNKLKVTPDAGGITGDSVSPNGTPTAISGSTTVKELYAEFRVPILADLPWAQKLAFNGAARYSEYNTAGVGGVWSTSAGLQWQVNNDFTVRLQKQRAIRAPGVDELYGAQSNGVSTVRDPCSDATAASAQTAQLRSLCIATGVPSSNVFTVVVQPLQQTGILSGGNPNVGPETADTVTLGLVYTPRQIRGLALSLDWFDIKLDGAISGFAGGVANTYNLCYNISQDANSAYCKAIHRDPVSGEITSNVNDQYYMDQRVANTGGIKTSGVDFNANYGFDVNYSPFGGRSRIDLGTSWTYTSEYTFQPVQALSLENECVGSYGSTCGLPAPKWKGVNRITWTNGPLTLSIHDRYTGKVERDTYLLPLRQGKTPPAKSDISAEEIDGIHYIDLSFALDLPHQIELTGGIENVFDKDPPILGGGAPTWGFNTGPGVYEVYGRSYFLGLKKKF